MVNSTDPANQLQWLVHILQASEDKGEKVSKAKKIIDNVGSVLLLKFGWSETKGATVCSALFKICTEL